MYANRSINNLTVTSSRHNLRTETTITMRNSRQRNVQNKTSVKNVKQN